MISELLFRLMTVPEPGFAPIVKLHGCALSVNGTRLDN